MKLNSQIVFLSILVCILTVGSYAQSKPTSEADYRGTFMYAVSETNSAYPVILNVETEEFINGKSVRKSTEIVENESEGYHRSTKTIIEGGKTTEVNEILVGFGNGFCREGNGAWRPSKYVCQGPDRLFRPRVPESVMYGVEDKMIDGKIVKIYRKYAEFSAGNEKDVRKTFKEQIATIDSNGYFISVVDIQGMLEPKEITRTQKETWTTRAKIKPIVAPIK